MLTGHVMQYVYSRVQLYMSVYEPRSVTRFMKYIYYNSIVYVIFYM